MKCFESGSHDPAYNLALEEYIFTNSREDVLLLWQNRPCVIIGRNQHILAEVKADAGLPVIRRSTGGGAVYQDMGNVNFSYFTDAAADDYSSFVGKIVAALQALGIPGEFNGRNDICVGGFKVSGSAAREENGRTLCHCTMLISADIGKMSDTLTPDTSKLARNGVKSIGARVGNLAEMFPGLSTEAVKSAVRRAFGAQEPLTYGENSGIMDIMNEKYANPIWNNQLL